MSMSVLWRDESGKRVSFEISTLERFPICALMFTAGWNCFNSQRYIAKEFRSGWWSRGNLRFEHIFPKFSLNTDLKIIRKHYFIRGVRVRKIGVIRAGECTKFSGFSSWNENLGRFSVKSFLKVRSFDQRCRSVLLLLFGSSHSRCLLLCGFWLSGYDIKILCLGFLSGLLGWWSAFTAAGRTSISCLLWLEITMWSFLMDRVEPLGSGSVNYLVLPNGQVSTSKRMHTFFLFYSWQQFCMNRAFK